MTFYPQQEQICMRAFRVDVGSTSPLSIHCSFTLSSVKLTARLYLTQSLKMRKLSSVITFTNSWQRPTSYCTVVQLFLLYFNPLKPHFAVERLERLLHIWETPASNIVPEVNCPYCGFLYFPSDPQGKWRNISVMKPLLLPSVCFSVYCLSVILS
jgi:hypothetical protein